MLPCNACHRHIHDQEPTCPFCGATQRHESSPLRELIAVLGVSMALLGSVACTPDTIEDPQANTSADPSGDTTIDSDSDTTPDTSADSSTSASANGTDDTTDPQTNTSGSFYAGADFDIGPPPECDPFEQDCPEGEKCVAYASDGDTWDDVKCVPVLGDGQPGDPCTYAGYFESTDDCDQDSFCFNVTENEQQQLVGECTALCKGTADDPICDEGQACFIEFQDALNVCLETCNPIVQDCPDETESCYWANVAFMCLVEEEPGPDGACDQLNECPAGEACLDTGILPDCVASSCCSSFCDTQDPEACPEEALNCGNWFAEDDPFFEQYPTLGVCYFTGF